jgi:hypothetical protein
VRESTSSTGASSWSLLSRAPGRKLGGDSALALNRLELALEHASAGRGADGSEGTSGFLEFRAGRFAAFEELECSPAERVLASQHPRQTARPPVRLNDPIRDRGVIGDSDVAPRTRPSRSRPVPSTRSGRRGVGFTRDGVGRQRLCWRDDVEQTAWRSPRRRWHELEARVSRERPLDILPPGADPASGLAGERRPALPEPHRELDDAVRT